MMNDWNFVQENQHHGGQEKARVRTKWTTTTTKGTVRMAKTTTGPQTTRRTCGGFLPLDRSRGRQKTEGIVPRRPTHGCPCISYVSQPYRRVCHLCASL